MLSKILFIVMLVLMFACIVIVHEWGHFIMAKKNGVLVHEFAIGMGPKLWSKQKGETLYSVRLLPIGGFCSMEEEVGESKNPNAMSAKKPWQKLLIVGAGAFMNFLLAWILISIVAGYMGYVSTEIKSIEPDMPAEQVGMLIGDRIIAINDIPVKKLADLSKALNSKEETTYKLTIKRKEMADFDVNVTTKMMEDGVARFGFTGNLVHYDIGYNVSRGFTVMCDVLKQIWGTLVQLVTGQVGVDQMAGIVGVVDQTSKQWDESVEVGGLGTAMMDIIWIAGLLSANLGIFNLLPFPALDGGRIVFIVIEMIRGKAISAEKEGAVHFIGMVLLMLLTLVVFYNDIMRL